MNRDHLADRLLGLKLEIQRWLKPKAEDSATDVDRIQRNAEKLIWKLQERYGYIHVRQEQSSQYPPATSPDFIPTAPIAPVRPLEVSQRRAVHR